MVGTNSRVLSTNFTLTTDWLLHSELGWFARSLYFRLKRLRSDLISNGLEWILFSQVWPLRKQAAYKLSNQGTNSFKSFPAKGTRQWGWKCLAQGHYCRCQQIRTGGPHNWESMVLSTEPQQLLLFSVETQLLLLLWQECGLRRFKFIPINYTPKWTQLHYWLLHDNNMSLYRLWRYTILWHRNVNYWSSVINMTLFVGTDLTLIVVCPQKDNSQFCGRTHLVVYWSYLLKFLKQDQYDMLI